MTNLNEAYAELVEAENEKKSFSAAAEGASQKFYSVICEASKTDENGEENVGFDIPRSVILEDIAQSLNLKVEVEIQTTDGRAILKDGKPVKRREGLVDASNTFKKIRAAVRKLEAINPEIITDDWKETRKAYTEQLASEKTPAQLVKTACKALIKKFDIATLRLIAETILAYCDKAEIDLQSDQAKEA
tara:strand:- start:344 stop:910 length:567 start_codon:yes stop_codon:yes gene_type:complete